MSEGGEGSRSSETEKPWGLGKDIETYRAELQRELLQRVGVKREVRRNEDGSKTFMTFVNEPLGGFADHTWRGVMKLRELATLAGIKETFAPMVLPPLEQGDETYVHLGWEETISREALKLLTK